MLLGILNTAIYIICAVLFSRKIADERLAKIQDFPLGLALLLLAAALHGGQLYLGFTYSADASMVIIASALSLTMLLVLSILSAKLQHASLLPVTMSFAALCTLMVAIVPQSGVVFGTLTPAMLLHIALSLSAYGCVVVGLLYAIQMRYIHGQLKTKALNFANSGLPPLIEVENWVLRLIGLGTMLLGLSLISGFVSLQNILDSQHAHKTVLSLIALGIFSGMLYMHRRSGLKIQVILSTTAIGVFILTLAYFGSRIVRELIITS